MTKPAAFSRSLTPSGSPANGPTSSPRRQALGKRPRLPQGALGVHLDEGVEAGVELRDAGEGALHEVDGRELA